MRSGVWLGLTVVVIFILAFFILPRLSPSTVSSLVITLLFLAIMILLVYRHARTCGYHCAPCGHEFAISIWVDFLSPHGFGRKLLRCPRCRIASWCNEIDRAAIRLPGETEEPIPEALPAEVGWLYVQVAIVLILYAALWGVTLFGWPSSAAASTGLILKIPLAAGLLPILHAIFCLFAARQGYQSRIYPAVTVFVAAFLLLAVWMQWTVFSRLA
jgi:DNA-directed RNA polymerase subunit RPC12/RpoP